MAEGRGMTKSSPGPAKKGPRNKLPKRVRSKAKSAIKRGMISEKAAKDHLGKGY